MPNLELEPLLSAGNKTLKTDFNLVINLFSIEVPNFRGVDDVLLKLERMMYVFSEKCGQRGQRD